MTIAVRAILALSLIAVAAVPASSNSGPSHPADRVEQRCHNASPHAAMLSCYLASVATSQTLVQRAFVQNLRSAEDVDSQFNADAQLHNRSGSSLAGQLRTSQAAWLRYAASQCAFEGASSFGGSGTDILEAECRYRMNVARLRELKAATELLTR